MNLTCTIIALVSLIFGVAAVWYALTAVKFVRDYNEKSVALHEITKLSSEQLLQADSIAHLNKKMQTLSSRIGMRKHREGNSGDDLPDSIADPKGWKREMRLRLHEMRFK